MISPYVFPGVLVKDLPKDLTIRRGGAHVDVRSINTHRVIVDAIEAVTGLPMQEYSGGKRWPDVVNARRLYVYQVKTRLNWSLELIGEKMGGRDHTTMTYSIKKYHDLFKTDEVFRENAIRIDSIVEKKLVALQYA